MNNQAPFNPSLKELVTVEVAQNAFDVVDFFIQEYADDSSEDLKSYMKEYIFNTYVGAYLIGKKDQTSANG